jgi:hypothetical protein
VCGMFFSDEVKTALVDRTILKTDFSTANASKHFHEGCNVRPEPSYTLPLQLHWLAAGVRGMTLGWPFPMIPPCWMSP